MPSPPGPLLIWAIVGLVWQDLLGMVGSAGLVMIFISLDFLIVFLTFVARLSQFKAGW